jgi:ABC-type sulfate transport system permease subunit
MTLGELLGRGIWQTLCDTPLSEIFTGAVYVLMFGVSAVVSCKLQ